MRALLPLLLLFPLPLAAQDLAGHKFLVTLNRTGDTEIFLADPTTGDLTNLTRSPKTEDRYPCWSPDGRRVAFTRDRGEFKDLYVMDADGRNAKRIVKDEATCYLPSWQTTPAGERIVFGMSGGKAEIVSVNPDGSDLKILGEGQDPCLSPDGKKICYAGEVKGGMSVFVMQYDGKKPTKVTDGVSTAGLTPNWSPDSKRLVYSFPVEKALELFVADAEGKNPKQITTFGGSAVCIPAEWSPDGRWISFRKTDEQYWANPDRLKAVLTDKPADKRPVWVVRPDGKEAKAVECLKYQCAFDGSRASWRPRGVK